VIERREGRRGENDGTRTRRFQPRKRGRKSKQRENRRDRDGRLAAK